MNWAAITWLVLLVLFLMTEASTVAVVSLWFAAGALVALIVSLLNGPIWLQIVLFVGVSGVLLALLRPLVRKFMSPRLVATNVDAVIGRTGFVTIDIDNVAAKGQVKLGAMEWTARSSDNSPLPAGTLIRVDRVEGVKVFVSPADKNNQK